MTSDRHRKVPSMKSPITPDRDVHCQSPQKALERKRSCTDIPCCILFLLFIICFVILSIFAFIEGDPRQLVHPTDSQGHLCGSGAYADRPYLYFFDWTKCIKAIGISSEMLKGRPFVCPTPQVCVKECPNRTSYYTFQSYHANRVCVDNFDGANESDEELVNAGKCASYILASKPLFGRCVPEHLQNLASYLTSVLDDDGKNKPILDSNAQPLNESKVEQGVKYLVDLLNLKEVAAFLVEDFTTSWPYILIGLGLAAVISFVWIVLMRWLAKPIIWLGIILFILLLAIVSGLAFLNSCNFEQKNDNQIFTEFKFVADANYIEVYQSHG